MIESVDLSDENLRDKIYDWLTSRIISGSLEPGQSVTIGRLAADLSVSQTPIREALASFEGTGLLVRAPRKGYRVASALSPEELGLVLDARMVIEAAAASRAYARADEDFLRQLRAAVAVQEDHVNDAENFPSESGAASMEAYFKADGEFHRLILEQCGNPFLAGSAKTLAGHWHRARFTAQHGIRDEERAVKEHRGIIAALEAGPAEEVERAMHDHIWRIRRETTEVPEQD